MKACDSFYYYTGLFAAKEVREQEVMDVVPQDTASTRRSYLPKLAGLNSSKHLAHVAEQERSVKCENAGMDFVVTPVQSTEVNPDHKPSGLGPSQPAIDPLNLESCVAAYRKFFLGKLRIEEIPDAHTRGAIFRKSDAILGEVGSIFLSALSHRVAEFIDPALAPKKSIFKLLFGLYRGGAFSYDASATDGRFNPASLDVSSKTRCGTSAS